MVKLPEFSQLVTWGKCLQQNVYSKDSTREAPRTERAKHFRGPGKQRRQPPEEASHLSTTGK